MQTRVLEEGISFKLGSTCCFGNIPGEVSEVSFRMTVCSLNQNITSTAAVKNALKEVETMP